MTTTPQEHDSTARRRGHFPGWTMLGVAAVAQYMSAPGQSYSVAAFKDPMREGLGLTETDYSLAYAFATVVSACLLPIAGRMVDRVGARLMIPIISAGLGLSCMYMSRIHTLPELYIAFCFVRSLGQGALTLASVWLVGEWFERKRGIATAIAGIGGSVSVMSVPLINNWLITRYGWESAWFALGITVWVTLVLPAFLLVRDRPEELGLKPDGTTDDETDSSVDIQNKSRPYVASADQSWTVREVMTNATFWKLLSVPATRALVVTGLIFHQVGLLGGHGLAPTWALGMMTIQASFATALCFPAGWATDRFESRYILCFSMLVLTAAMILMIAMPHPWFAVVYALLLGLLGSILRSTATVVWINYYGRTHQGAVRGVAWSAMILASAAGPLPLAFSIDALGSYAPALYFFLTLPVLAAIAVWTAHPPRRDSSTAP